ncbi:Serine/threonine-protein kinase/endoribonuclease IRE2 [Lamellibrachia satsuma]|nr:Serine/threonine-protein kinase/endoribonuclease IRE2 [Lamellibrachia satsuma]
MANDPTLIDSGTPRWKAREVLQPGGHYNTASEIYVAGLVTFYMMSGGRHPFHAASAADVKRKMVNGRSDSNLSAVQDLVAVDMVKKMLADNQADRPFADTLLRHGYLWTNDKRFKFLAAVGDEAEIATYGSKKWKHNATAVVIESTKATVLPTAKTDWFNLKVMPMLGRDFQDDFKKESRQTPHNYTKSMCHLLRTLRNIQSHYPEQSAATKAILGNTRYPYAYFDQELPMLFPTVYFIIRNTAGQPDDWTQRDELKKFFK